MFYQVNTKALLQMKLDALKQFLQEYGFKVDKEKLESIHETIIIKENRSIEDIKNNPYVLYSFFDFNTIDKLVIKNNTEITNTDYRIISAIPTIFDKKITLEGHTVFTKKSLIDDILKSLSINEDKRKNIANLIDRYSEKNIIIKDLGNDYVTSIKLYNIEKTIYNTLRINAEKMKGEIINKTQVRSFIENEEREIGFSYSQNQSEIIYLANKRYNIFSLNGYAGAGKTTTAKSILSLYNKIYKRSEIISCALSGVAANRAKLVTGYNSVTVHSLLGYNGEDFSKNANNKLDYKFIMLDEAGMIDSELFFRLLEAIDFNKTTLMIAGDDAQLQSVSNGDVYNDILTLKLCRTITLDKVYRQKEEQVINTMAQSIRVAKTPPNFTQKGYDDFEFHTTFGENTKDTIKEISSQYVKKGNELLLQGNYKDFITFFQVIAPIKKRDLGVYALNNMLQDIFNDTEDENFLSIKTKDQNTKIKAKDKVIHLKNQKMQIISRATYNKLQKGEKLTEEDILETKVFNGQVGIVLSINKKHGNIGANFVYYPDNEYIAIYTNKDIEKYGALDLAYAITVHKSQGSQYESVIMPMVSQYYRMLNNKLLYTAITRAKNMLYIVGEQSSFKRGCINNIEIKRDTILKLLVS